MSGENDKQVLDLARYLHCIVADIHELSDPRATTPRQNMENIRTKAAAGLKEAKRMGVLS
jgi:ElaB/YqjD/DUF883 family membrane-anchored ribosome-binding protein